MVQKVIICCFLLLAGSSISAQVLTGTVTNEEGTFLFGATVIWDETSIGTIVNEDGSFSLPRPDTTALLRIDYVGYESAYVEVLPEEADITIMIEGVTDLMAVEVAAERRDNYVSTLSTLNVETIGSGEFRKAPCCNLAESFSTNAAVDVAYSDAVTGAREIRMLGLRGAYTQLLMEKRPLMTGLGAAFVMEYIPGTWLESIQISKGTGTVQNGYNAITGQINTELVKPWLDKKFFINAYGSTFGRGELNIHLNRQLSEKWSSGLLLHASTRNNTIDQNNDTFYDTPQKTMYDGIWRTFYRGNVVRFQVNVHALRDRHTAGQIPAKANDLPYLINQDNDRVDLFAKIGYLGFENPNITVGLITDLKWHQLDSRYGFRTHRGTQKSGYVSGMVSHGFNGLGHKLDAGFTYSLDDYNEFLDDRFIGRREEVAGIYTEYTYAPTITPEANGFADKIGFVAGARLDHNNLFGWLFTPRANLKYNFSDDRVIRFSAGRGFRTANVIAENTQVLATNREIVIADDLDIESAWNFGFNFTQNFDIAGRRGSIAFDAYHTRFTNQIILDNNSDYTKIQFYNLMGESRASSLLTVLSYELVKGLEAKVGYKYNNVQMSFLDEPTRQRPMVARHRGLFTLDYKMPNEKWEFNLSTQFVGRQEFIDLSQNPFQTEEQKRGYASPYALANFQVTHNFANGLEIYTGVENLTGFRQDTPILGASEPFGPDFDATHAYAPITGQMGYVGLRWGF